MKKKLLVVTVPALNASFLGELKKRFGENGFIYRVFKPPFCALTLPVQASLYTGVLPQNTGIVSNGIYLEKINSISFWNQSHGFIEQQSFWKQKKLKVALIFMQLSMGSGADIVVTPKPIHLHHGGMIDYCYTKPSHLWAELTRTFGLFKLKWYWGPFVSIKSSEWIKNATIFILNNYLPDIAFTYIPHMDYISQKIGYNNRFTTYNELEKIVSILRELLDTSEVLGYDSIIFSDYGADFVDTVYYPNKILREEKFLRTYKVQKYEYLDMYESDAFALCDHQITYIFCNKEGIQDGIYRLFKDKYPNCDIFNKEELLELGIYHKNMGDIALFAKQGWFSYKWWDKDEIGPDYKKHIDIHRKEGYDPTELFFDFWNFGIAQNDSLVKMSMGNGFLSTNNGVFFGRLTYDTDFFTMRNEVGIADIVKYIRNLM